MSLTLAAYREQVTAGNVTPQEVVADYVTRANNEDYNAYVRTHQEYVDDHLEEFADRTLQGAPIAVKDIILTKGYETTCGSEILDGYTPPYSATCFERLEAAGGLMIGKANMDEFAMGASGENSAFGPTKNPLDTSRVPGGSSSGSAAAVAADLCLAALGTDTGGSVRQPAAMCGLVGCKPTYGRVSRYGVQALASSLDQVGVITKDVTDAAILLEAIAGHDPKDATSVDRDDETNRSAQLDSTELADTKIAVPEQFFEQGLDDDLRDLYQERLTQLEAAGATVDRIDLPDLVYGVATYYVILPAEASTNLARFDGIKYGLQDDTMTHDSLAAYYQAIRERGFGAEVKRRILTGSYVLSAGHYDAYYRQAQKVRRKIKQEVDSAFEEYDLLVGPTTPTPARPLGEKIDDPVAMYMADAYTVIANLTGMPALSLPVGQVERDGNDLPVGLQIIGPPWQEGRILGAAYRIEQLLAG